MAKLSNKLVEIGELASAISEIYPFGYGENRMHNAQDSGNSLSFSPQERQRYEDDFKKYVLDRLGEVFCNAKYACVEPSYVETEWKDMIALHYINTTYSAAFRSRTIRVHFLSEKICDEQAYLGFITLRPIEEMQIALSYVFINWDNFPNLFGENAKFHFVGYQKCVHCMGRELYIHTYPLLVQDSIVTYCADVNILTLSRFLAHEYGGRKLEIRDICGDDYNVVYPREITRERFTDLCAKMHISLKTRDIYLKDLHDDLLSDASGRDGANKAEQPLYGSAAAIKTKSGILRYINAYLDSNLPIVVFVSGHVVQIVGYVDYDSKRQYLVLDDSGAKDPRSCPPNINSDSKLPKSRSCYFVDFSETFLHSPEEKKNEHSFNPNVFFKQIEANMITLGVPQGERVYIDYPNYETLMLNMIQHQWDAKSEQYAWFLDENGELKDSVQIRSRLVSGTAFIEYLNEHLAYTIEHKNEMESVGKDGATMNPLIANLQASVDFLKNIPLPHYLWYTELENENGIIIGLCADPTRFYENPSHLDHVFYNAMFERGKRGIQIVRSMWS